MRGSLVFRTLYTIGLWVSFLAAGPAAAGGLHLPASAPRILDHIYSGQTEAAISEARELQREMPEHPVGYMLEGEALWSKIWCTSAEFKYGMTMPRHREKLASDQAYLDLGAKTYALATANLARGETAEMHFYAGMGDALLARIYGLRWESRNAARAGVRARGNFERALAMDPSVADAYMGLGLYNYYVDTLSTMARMLRFVMGLPGGNKEEGIGELRRAIAEGEMTPAAARFYLALNLHNYDQRYAEALQVIEPLVERYPNNAVFLLVRGDLYAKLGRKELARASYRAAGAAEVADSECRKKVELLVRESMAAVGGL
jgi:tetratricopeptide (TPR) repeat protein